MRTITRAGALLPVTAAAAVLLAGCTAGGRGSPAAVGASHPATTTSPTPTTSPSPGAAPTRAATGSAASGVLSEADFVKQADEVCHQGLGSDPALLRPPANATDYARLASFTAAVTSGYVLFNRRIDALVARASDRTELMAKWRTPQDTYFNRIRPYELSLVQAAAKHDKTAVLAIGKQRNAVPRPDAGVVTFLDAYGLPTCAALTFH